MCVYDVACFRLLFLLPWRRRLNSGLNSGLHVQSCRLPLRWVLAGLDYACVEPAPNLTAPSRLAHFPRPPDHCCLLPPARGSALSPFLPRASARKFSALPFLLLHSTRASPTSSPHRALPCCCPRRCQRLSAPPAPHCWPRMRCPAVQAPQHLASTRAFLPCVRVPPLRSRHSWSAAPRASAVTPFPRCTTAVGLPCRVQPCPRPGSALGQLLHGAVP